MPKKTFFVIMTWIFVMGIIFCLATVSLPWYCHTIIGGVIGILIAVIEDLYQEIDTLKEILKNK